MAVTLPIPSYAGSDEDCGASGFSGAEASVPVASRDPGGLPPSQQELARQDDALAGLQALLDLGLSRGFDASLYFSGRESPLVLGEHDDHARAGRDDGFGGSSSMSSCAGGLKPGREHAGQEAA